MTFSENGRPHWNAFIERQGEKNPYRVIQISSFVRSRVYQIFALSPPVESAELWIKDSRRASICNVTYPQDASYISADPSYIYIVYLGTCSLSLGIPYSCPFVNYQATRYRRASLSRILAHGGVALAREQTTKLELEFISFNSQSYESRLWRDIGAISLPTTITTVTEWEIRADPHRCLLRAKVNDRATRFQLIITLLHREITLRE